MKQSTFSLLLLALMPSILVATSQRSLLIRNSDSFPVMLTVTTKTGHENFLLQPYGQRPLALVVPPDAHLTFVSTALGTLKLPARLIASQVALELYAARKAGSRGQLTLKIRAAT